MVANASPGAEAALAALVITPGVTASSGPFPLIFSSVKAGGREREVAVEGRDSSPAAVDQPLVTGGGWVRDGGIVVERSFAEALTIRVGDAVTVGGRSLRVVGIAVTTAWEPFAFRSPTVLLTGSTLLALLALVSVAVLVGGRLANQTRRVGLLKAVGATPRLVAAVLLAEHLLLALVAAAIGLAGGWLGAPLLARPAIGVLGSADAPPLTPGTVAAVVAAAVATVAVATVPPALQGARSSTIRALTSPSRQPRRSPAVLAASARMPVPVLLGMRFAARQPRRGVLATASLTLAVATVVATMTMNRAFAIERILAIAAGDAASNLLNDRYRQIVYVLGAALLLLAAVNTALLAWTSVLDTARPSALVRTLGATPRQVAAGAGRGAARAGARRRLDRHSGGLALFRVASNAAGGSQTTGTVPPLPWLLAVVPATLLATAAITFVPTHLGARHPVVATLRYE